MQIQAVKVGLVTLLEKIKINLHTIGCSLHQNEIPFRALFKHLDGTVIYVLG